MASRDGERDTQHGVGDDLAISRHRGEAYPPLDAAVLGGVFFELQ
jgi:hypothetical protein